MKYFARALGLAAACALLAAGSASAQAQSTDFPTKPIRMVVTFPPGGSADAVVRMLAPRLDEQARPAGGRRQPARRGRQHRPGGGRQGRRPTATRSASAPPARSSANVSLYPQMPFDPLKDFKPVAMLARDSVRDRRPPPRSMPGRRPS